MAHVFISFSSRDRDEAEQISRFLESRGIKCWLAPHAIPPGSDWPRTLVNAIESCPLLLVVLTRSANDSPHVALEVAHAVSHRRALLVVRTEGVEPTGNVAYFLGLSQRLDAFPPPLSQHLSQVAKGIESLLSSEAHALKSRADSRPPSTQQPEPDLTQESFTDAAIWQRLIRIGHWSFLAETGKIVGQGMFSYLLSSRDFGERPFIISSSLVFQGYEWTGYRASGGFVLGWAHGPRHHSYLHMLLTGERLLFEAIGSRGGDSYSDYAHLEDGVPFVVEDGREYEFQLQVVDTRITAFVDGNFLHTIQLPNKTSGRVGLRPWRAKMEIGHFAVSEQ